MRQSVPSVLGLALLCVVVGTSARARAAEHELAPELATGPLVFGDGPSPLEVGLPVDLALALSLADLFVLRAGVGFVPVVDRHGLLFLPRPRLEAAVRARLGRFLPQLGMGAATLGRSPAVHGLCGAAIALNASWQFGLDVRVGAFWDRDAARAGVTPFGEGQFRLARVF